MNTNINFPNLHIFLENVGKSLDIGNFSVAYYGIIIAIGMLAGIAIARSEARRTKQNQEDYLDLAIVAIIFSVIGARIYYVAFSWDVYKNDLGSIFNLRQGGLAIYGGVIAAIITTYIFTKVKKMSFPLVADTAGLGLLLGQIIGRWGNFFNREAFGGYTNNIFAMQLPLDSVRASDVTEELMAHLITVDGVSYIQVHPTFLYESMWNLALLLILLKIRKYKKFDGEVFLLYLAGYGIGRFWIENLRTDQLLIPGINVPVSMALALAMVITAVGIIVVKRGKAMKA